MHITRELVEHLTKLALLELKPEEVDRYVKELDAILQYVEKLNKLDTSKISPTYQVIPNEDVFRKDEVRKPWDIDEFLDVVPAHEDRTIKVPKIIDAH